MSKTTEPIISEMINSAGDGSGLQLPPAFVLVNPKHIDSIKKIIPTILMDVKRVLKNYSLVFQDVKK